jgi:hypothetical protein
LVTGDEVNQSQKSYETIFRGRDELNTRHGFDQQQDHFEMCHIKIETT